MFCCGRKLKSLYVYGCFVNLLFCLFFLLGIWLDGVDGIDVNFVDCLKGKQLVVMGDDFGNVNLYRYFCVSEKVSIMFILKVCIMFSFLCNLIFFQLCLFFSCFIVVCWLDGKLFRL